MYAGPESGSLSPKDPGRATGVKLDEILKAAYEADASDIHLISGQPPPVSLPGTPSTSHQRFWSLR